MRQKRAKTYRKLMSLYSLSFGFRQPYQVLVDSEFCKDANGLNTDVLKQVTTVLQGSVKPMITQCCIHELYLQGKAQQPAVDLAKTFERRKCNHREPIPGDECLSSVVGETNKHRYVIAAQSQPLRAKLRAIAGVPLVHIHRSVMILEPPSEATLAAKESAEEQGQQVSAPERAKIHAADAQAAPEPPRKKRKGPKGPNPLSVKKKKMSGDEGREPRGGASAKGKERAVGRTAGAGGEADVTLRAGAKRKRDGAEGEGIGEASLSVKMDGGGGEGEETHGEKQNAGHKRRRRRKAGVHEESTGQGEVGDGTE